MRRREDIEELIGAAQDIDLTHRLLAGDAPFERLTVEQLHHQIRHIVDGADVVDDSHGSGVADMVGGVALPEEAGPGLDIRDVLRVQDFDGGARTVAVRRLIDGRHTADIDQAIQVVLAA